MGQGFDSGFGTETVANVGNHERGRDEMEVETGEPPEQRPELRVFQDSENLPSETVGLGNERENSGNGNVRFLSARGGEGREVSQIMVRHDSEGVGRESAIESDRSKSSQYRVAPYHVWPELPHDIRKLPTGRKMGEGGES